VNKQTVKQQPRPVSYVCPTCGLKQQYAQDREDFRRCVGRTCRADCTQVIEQVLETRRQRYQTVCRREAAWADKGDQHAQKLCTEYFARWQWASRELENLYDFISHGCGQ